MSKKWCEEIPYDSPSSIQNAALNARVRRYADSTTSAPSPTTVLTTVQLAVSSRASRGSAPRRTGAAALGGREGQRQGASAGLAQRDGHVRERPRQRNSGAHAGPAGP